MVDTIKEYNPTARNVWAALDEVFAGRPKVVTLCGSTRFKDEINAANARLTMEGNLVISLGVFGHTDMPDHDWSTSGTEVKQMLDELHKRKIDLADEILVINVGGYIGESTRSEIRYAESVGVPVTYLEPPYPQEYSLTDPEGA
jgi:hypothetical protein